MQGSSAGPSQADWRQQEWTATPSSSREADSWQAGGVPSTWAPAPVTAGGVAAVPQDGPPRQERPSASSQPVPPASEPPPAQPPEELTQAPPPRSSGSEPSPTRRQEQQQQTQGTSSSSTGNDAAIPQATDGAAGSAPPLLMARPAVWLAPPPGIQQEPAQSESPLAELKQRGASDGEQPVLASALAEVAVLPPPPEARPPADARQGDDATAVPPAPPPEAARTEQPAQQPIRVWTREVQLSARHRFLAATLTHSWLLGEPRVGILTGISRT